MKKEVPEWMDFYRQYQNICTEIELIKSSLFYKPPFYKKLIKWLIGVSIIGSVPYQVNSFLSSSNSPVDYSISNFSATGTKIDKSGSIHAKTESNEMDSPTLNYTFSINGKFNLYSGKIKDAFLIYKEDDKNQDFSFDDLHTLEIKQNQLTAFHSYAFAFIPLWQSFGKTTYHSANFSLNEIHYHTTNSKLFYKPFYLLTVDEQNNIHVQLLIIKSKSGIMSISKDVNFIDSPQALQASPEYHLLSLSEILKAPSDKQSFGLSKEQVQQNVNQILDLFKVFYT